MADIQAFCGLRYDLSRVGALAEVVAPPYDVIDAEQQAALYNRNPYNVVRLILNRAEPGDDEEAVYRRAAKIFRDWKRAGVLVADNQPAFYVYHQIFKVESQEFTRRGFICRLRLEEFGNGKVFPHEETHSKAKRDRLLLTTHCQANMSPIFSIYPDNDNAVMDAVESGITDMTPIEATDNAGVIHRVWAATQLDAIRNATTLMGPHSLFIADGHHRYETALNYRRQLIEQSGPLPPDHPANYVLMCCISMWDPGMIVLPTHRLFRGLPSMTAEELAQKLGNAFQCEVVATGPDAANEIWERIEFEDNQSTLALYTNQDSKWTLVRLTDAGRKLMSSISQQSAEWNGLGVSILHKLIIDELLGQDSPPSPLYVRNLDELIAGLTNGDGTGRDLTGQEGTGEPFPLAAIVMPASVADVEAISLHGERMPAKSTFFYPKMLSGIVFNPLSPNS